MSQSTPTTEMQPFPNSHPALTVQANLDANGEVETVKIQTETTRYQFTHAVRAYNRTVLTPDFKEDPDTGTRVALQTDELPAIVLEAADWFINQHLAS